MILEHIFNYLLNKFKLLKIFFMVYNLFFPSYIGEPNLQSLWRPEYAAYMIEGILTCTYFSNLA